MPNMFPTRKTRHQNRKRFSHLNDFERDVIFGNAVSSGQQNVLVSNGSVDLEFIVNNNDGISTTNENTRNVQKLESCFNERIDKEIGNIVYTVMDKIQNVILIAIDSLITPRIELAVRSINPIAGRYAASVTANSERGERLGITTSSENVCQKKQHISWLKLNWWNSGKHPKRGRWIVGSKNTLRPATAHSSHQCPKIPKAKILKIWILPN